MREEDCRVGVVALIFDDDGRVLMEKRDVDAEDGNRWGFIAGGKKSEESLVEAVKREVNEEVDAKFIPDSIVGVIDHESYRQEDVWWTVAGFEGTVEGEVRNAEPEKREKIGWFRLENVPEELHHTSKKMLNVYRKEVMHEEID